MSSKLPIGVATIERPLIILSIIYILIFIISCTPVNLSKQDTKNTQETTISEKSFDTNSEIKPSSVIVDLDSDGNNEIIFGDNNGMIRALNHNGIEIINDFFPSKIAYIIDKNPILGRKWENTNFFQKLPIWAHSARIMRKWSA